MKKKISMLVLIALVLSLATPSVFALSDVTNCSEQDIMGQINQKVKTQNRGNTNENQINKGYNIQSIISRFYSNCKNSSSDSPASSDAVNNNSNNTVSSNNTVPSNSNTVSNDSNTVCCNCKITCGNCNITCDDCKITCDKCNITSDQLQSILKNLNNNKCGFKIVCNDCNSKSNSSSSDSNTNSDSSSNTNPNTSSNTNSNINTNTSSDSGSYSTFQKRVVQLVNEQRAANGLKPLSENSELDNVATLKSQDMAKLNYFSHTSPTYGSPFDMLHKFGVQYRAAGENIAMGQSTPEEVMKGWMNSPGHRANILNSNFTKIGVGITKNAQGRYIWTQTFIG